MPKRKRARPKANPEFISTVEALLTLFPHVRKKVNTLNRPGLQAAQVHGKDLAAARDRTDSIKNQDLLAFVVCRNERVRLPFFLEYYRRKGVEHFLFIDNDSDDGTAAFLDEQDDCSVWKTDASYKDSKFGVHWLNYLLREYGTGHWCLTLDPDEFLVTPYDTTRSLKELTAYLDSQKKESFFSVMLDMYPEGSVDAATYTAGQDPLAVAPWFDPCGYHQELMPACQDWWIRGGVRRRVFFRDAPEDAPALNKTVLVKWKRHFHYLSSTHVLSPLRLNSPHFRDTLAPTGCLLHFKYLAHFKDKVAEEMQRRQHYAGSREYRSYHSMFRQGSTLWCEGSARYRDWQQLADLGLMTRGRWF
jgi:hypothetical protein